MTFNFFENLHYVFLQTVYGWLVTLMTMWIRVLLLIMIWLKLLDGTQMIRFVSASCSVVDPNELHVASLI